MHSSRATCSPAPNYVPWRTKKTHPTPKAINKYFGKESVNILGNCRNTVLYQLAMLMRDVTFEVTCFLLGVPLPLVC